MYLINVSTATLPKAPAGFTYNELGELVEVGDRFYSQQLASTGSAPGFKSGKVEKVKAPTKAELVSAFGVDISALTKSDLEAVLQSTPKPVTIPNGRLKAPFIAACKEAYCDADFSKLTVATMRELLEKANKS